MAAQANEKMKRLELWRWRHYDPVRKRHCTTSFVLSEADAAVQFRDGGVPENETYANTALGFMKGPPDGLRYA